MEKNNNNRFDKKPEQMKRKDGSSKYAFVTFLMMNDSFLPGVLMLGNQLRKGNYGADLVCLVTEKISDISKKAISIVFDHVIEVDEIYLHHKRRQQRQDRPFLFTRFHALRLGTDGDMGYNYDKIVMLDADVLPLKNYSHLFTLDTPAGTVNEKKEYTMEYNSEGKYIIPENVEETMQWIWHETYNNICPHGFPIPAEICNKVLSNPNNMGVNSSLLVLTPSMKEFRSILEDVKKPETMNLIGNVFNWPEMQYATIKWAGQWKNIDLIFNGFGGYPKISLLFGMHFAGFKPWSFKDTKKIYTLGKKSDFLFWYDKYIEMLSKDYPQLMKVNPLKKLHDKIIGLLEENNA